MMPRVDFVVSVRVSDNNVLAEFVPLEVAALSFRNTMRSCSTWPCAGWSL